MQITTRQGPAFGVARLALGPNEPVRAEAGAMMAMSSGVALESKMEGGLLRSLKRAALGGESFFVNTYTAPPQGGWVDVAARLPGDLTSMELAEGRSLFVQKGSWLASAASVQLDAQWGGFKNLFGSEGGFILRAAGTGPIVVSCYGALETWTLEAGQSITLDTGHMVAYEDTVTMSLRKVAGGIVQTVKSGEGLVFDFTGPGKVLSQTRNPTELIGWIQSFLGTGNSGASGVGGALGGLLGRD
jgi:uncharacterized protein (TIGR00266 family)